MPLLLGQFICSEDKLGYMTDQLVKYTMFLYPEACRVAKSPSAGNTGDARAKVAKKDTAASAAFREKCTILRNTYPRRCCCGFLVVGAR